MGVGLKDVGALGERVLELAAGDQPEGVRGVVDQRHVAAHLLQLAHGEGEQVVHRVQEQQRGSFGLEDLPGAVQVDLGEVAVGVRAAALAEGAADQLGEEMAAVLCGNAHDLLAGLGQRGEGRLHRVDAGEAPELGVIGAEELL
nr:hypothetical protein GCM10020092_053340 [Actinoplanes digitatis]